MRGPRVTHQGPTSNWFLYWIGRLYLAVTGWSIEGDVHGSKGVIIGFPHTSNWDFVVLVAVSWVLRLKLSWIGKDSLFKPPLGWLLRILGGIGIDRSGPQGMVGDVGRKLREADRLFVTVPPSGTRSRTEYWKSGFYFMAVEGRVPITLGFMDWRRKVAGLGPAIEPSGDVKADMDRIREFYAGMEGKFPDETSTIRLKQEEASPQA